MPKLESKPFTSCKRKPRISYLVRNQLVLVNQNKHRRNLIKSTKSHEQFLTNFSELLNDRIFKPHGRIVFSPNYIPTTLYHMENVMRQLVNVFRMIITNHTSTGRNVVVYGPAGTGKTLAVRAFANDIVQYMRNEHKQGDPILKYFHIDCQKWKSSDSILTSMLCELMPSFSVHNHDDDDSLYSILDSLMIKQNLVLLLVLNKIDLIPLSERTSFLTSLLQLQKERLNLILLARKPDLFHSSELVPAELIEILSLPALQLFDVLNDRAERAFHPTAYTDTLLQHIAQIGENFPSHRVRRTLDLLCDVADIASLSQSSTITVTHVRSCLWR